MKVIKCEAKNEQEALDKALEIANARSDETYYYFENVQGGLFKGKKVGICLVTKYDVKNFIKDFLEELANKMNTKFNIEIKESEVGFNVVVLGDNNAALIGKDGKTLKSIQTILFQSLQKEGKFDIKINLDISDYKARKESHLEREIRMICRDVKRTKVSAKLDPMNSYDRRIVHNVVSTFDCLESHSEDEGKNRHVVITYKKD